MSVYPSRVLVMAFDTVELGYSYLSSNGLSFGYNYRIANGTGNDGVITSAAFIAKKSLVASNHLVNVMVLCTGGALLLLLIILVVISYLSRRKMVKLQYRYWYLRNVAAEGEEAFAEEKKRRQRPAAKKVQHKNQCNSSFSAVSQNSRATSSPQVYGVDPYGHGTTVNYTQFTPVFPQQPMQMQMQMQMPMQAPQSSFHSALPPTVTTASVSPSSFRMPPQPPIPQQLPDPNRPSPETSTALLTPTPLRRRSSKVSFVGDL